MRLKYSFESVDMGDEIILVPVGENSNEVHGVVKLNREGLEIVNLLKEDTTLDSIVETLSNKYENDRNTITLWVKKAINTLNESGLIDYM